MRVVKGTPIHGESKCITCANCTHVQGHAEGSEIIRCDILRQRVPFSVARCSEYEVRGTLSLHSMFSMAKILEKREDGKYGFRTPSNQEKYGGD